MQEISDQHAVDQPCAAEVGFGKVGDARAQIRRCAVSYDETKSAQGVVRMPYRVEVQARASHERRLVFGRGGEEAEARPGSFWRAHVIPQHSPNRTFC